MRDDVSALGPAAVLTDRSVMQEPVDVRKLMPLMREFGDLARRRVGVGINPLEYQRYLDLKARIGEKFPEKAGPGVGGGSRRGERPGLTRLVVAFANRAALIASIIDNIKPAGLLVRTPFAAEVGTRFLLKLSLEHEEEVAEIPATVVTSISQGSHTLSTTSMGMSLKIEKMNATQNAGVSRVFAHELDRRLGLLD